MCFCEGKNKIDDSIMKVKSKDMLIERRISKATAFRASSESGLRISVLLDETYIW